MTSFNLDVIKRCLQSKLPSFEGFLTLEEGGMIVARDLTGNPVGFAWLCEFDSSTTVAEELAATIGDMESVANTF